MATAEDKQRQQSLTTDAARQLSTTTKSQPQMQGITSRWLLRLLPWVETKGGVYRLNRRRSFTVGDGRLSFVSTGSQVQVVPQELGELPLLRGYDDPAALAALAAAFEQREIAAGGTIVQEGQPADRIYLVAHGKAQQVTAAKYGDNSVLNTFADGDYFGGELPVEPTANWAYTVTALTDTTVLSLAVTRFNELAGQFTSLQAKVDDYRANRGQPKDQFGQAPLDLAAGHTGEPPLPGTYVDYETSPREFELSVAQTVLQIHTRVADLYNEPMNQVEQQLRLTIEALRETQEDQIVNNPDFGLLNNTDFEQRLHTRSGPPTPDDMDDLLALVWKDPAFFLAHPRAMAAFGQECSRRGVYPHPVLVGGNMIPAWRGIPIYPCNKIPVTNARTSSILLMRTGEHNQGVIGLHQTGIPDEYQPALSVRFMGINEKAIMSYLVSAYYSAAVMIPDAIGMLENVEIGRMHD